MNHKDPEYDFVDNIINIPQEMIEDPQPYEFFKLLLPEETINLMVKESNLYAEQTISNLTSQNKLTPFTEMKLWKPLSNYDMNQYLGMIFWMGLLSNFSIEGK